MVSFSMMPLSRQSLPAVEILPKDSERFPYIYLRSCRGGGREHRPLVPLLLLPWPDTERHRTGTLCQRASLLTTCYRPLACRIFCTSVIETTALALSDPDGAVRAQESAAQVVDIPAMNGA
jgi:hypothetical protein